MVLTLLVPRQRGRAELGKRQYAAKSELLLNNYDVNSTSLRYIGNLYGGMQLLSGLKFRTTDGGQHVVLRGLNERKDFLYVVLDRVDCQYTLSESTLSAGQY